MKAKKLQIIMEDDSVMEFEIKFPLRVSQQFGIKRLPSPIPGLMDKVHNGLETLVLISAPLPDSILYDTIQRVDQELKYCI